MIVVDDDLDIANALKMFLLDSMPGLNVVAFASGAEGLAFMRKTPVHLVMADFRMPAMDGLQFLTEARVVAPNTARIMFTAYPDMILATRALEEARIVYFFTKPLDPTNVAEVVQELLGDAS